MSDQELRTLLKTSPKEAHRKIFAQYSNYVYAVVFSKLRCCASQEDIEECVSDAFLEVFRHYHADYEGTLHGFISIAAKRKAIDYYHRLSGKSGFSVSLDDETAPELPSDADIEQDYEQKALRQTLLDRISELGEPDATIIIQKYFYRRKAEEIAKMVSLSPANVRKRSERAIKRLKTMLSKEELS